MHALKPIITVLTLAFLWAIPAEAQQRGRIYRTEVTPFDTRHDADMRIREKSAYLKKFAPQASADGRMMSQEVDMPLVWNDGNVYMHLENVPQPYTLWVNNQEVAKVDDHASPAEFAITPYIRQGVNSLQVELRPVAEDALSQNRPVGSAFEGSLVYYQDKRSVRDYEVWIRPDSMGGDYGLMQLNAVVQNSYNYDEPVTVCYDIYSPTGELIDFNVTEVTIPGQSIDTVRFSTFVYGAFNHKWQAGTHNPSLYKVMLFTRRHGAYKEYMPMKVGFGETTFENGQIMRFGKPIVMKKVIYNATDRKSTTLKLQSFKRQGFNTITPNYPQPAWFYELCDKYGLYVIDQADINLPDERTNRRVGGTPTNDPSRVDEFVERVKAMYYRSRNYSCVIAYSLGNPSGNGYNMYKAYEWLKSVEKRRPVIYTDAAGEWNSDL